MTLSSLAADSLGASRAQLVRSLVDAEVASLSSAPQDAAARGTEAGACFVGTELAIEKALRKCEVPLPPLPPFPTGRRTNTRR